jgi:hypothetical protein
MGGKDSAEVVTFLSLFAKLKEWTDDDTEDLVRLAKRDESIRNLCNDLFWAAHVLEMNERKRRELFAAPVDPKFIEAWRDYEDRFQTVVDDVVMFDLSPELVNIQPSKLPRADFQWKVADDQAEEQAQGILDAIKFAEFNAEQDWRWEKRQSDFINGILEGVAAFDRLKESTGFDLRDVFRRRALVPFILIPRSIASKQGSIERAPMLKNLKQAHDAFVFGATYAALALMRSIMEAVLRDHYKAEGKDLSERIRSARGRLPPGANEGALHRLRKLANAILHLDPTKDEDLPNMEAAKLEKEIVSLLYVLRALIEGAK